jgi:hypothetical protein
VSDQLSATSRHTSCTPVAFRSIRGSVIRPEANFRMAAFEAQSPLTAKSQRLRPPAERAICL